MLKRCASSNWNKTHPWLWPSKRLIHSVTHHMLWENKPGTRELEAGFERGPPGHWNPAQHPGHRPGDLQKKEESAPLSTGTDHRPFTCGVTPGARALSLYLDLAPPPARSSTHLTRAHTPCGPGLRATWYLFPGTWNSTWHFWALGTDLQNQ